MSPVQVRVSNASFWPYDVALHLPFTKHLLRSAKGFHVTNQGATIDNGKFTLVSRRQMLSSAELALSAPGQVTPEASSGQEGSACFARTTFAKPSTACTIFASRAKIMKAPGCRLYVSRRARGGSGQGVVGEVDAKRSKAVRNPMKNAIGTRAGLEHLNARSDSLPLMIVSVQ